MSVLFLGLDQIVRTHVSLIETYGGEAGIRDLGLLHSAIAVPQASFGGERLYDDLFDMAAAYLYHIVQNHPFVDGNKRTGAAAAIIFLAMNGIEIEADEDGLVEMTMAVAQSRVGKREIAAFFRQRSQ
jgi:death-on-curing protein